VVTRDGQGTGADGHPFAMASMTGSAGTSLLEVVLVLALMSSLLGLGLPMLTRGADARRANDAARFVAGQFRLARQRAVMTGRRSAVVFDEVAGEFGWRLCEDLDRDGVSRADIAAGTDRCEAPAQPMSIKFPQVRIAFAPGVPSPDGLLDASPLRFGLGRMAVFTATGTASSGTVAILGQGDNQLVVRVSGVTGRTRVLRFDRSQQAWVE
jgi:type II secretory pathway pseudopilin PulG